MCVGFVLACASMVQEEVVDGVLVVGTQWLGLDWLVEEGKEVQ